MWASPRDRGSGNAFLRGPEAVCQEYFDIDHPSGWVARGMMSFCYMKHARRGVPQRSATSSRSDSQADIPADGGPI
ncbi:hypothetical protein NicSoilB8_18780 [Arthrobacter sp. NicSoilB8]|nr:hypothetical protein NicSoilB8_18780 [Arthrobacter sp. NicSoilB8]